MEGFKVDQRKLILLFLGLVFLGYYQLGFAQEVIARGKVYLDANGNGTYDDGESGLAGIKVSNGRDVIKTDHLGKYTIKLP
ncbi:MAG: hypothetical protein KDC53_19450, partial [Saprospiraceae bacterium]|nr:hypothetical protein [Saprospiraceae bacterium]